MKNSDGISKRTKQVIYGLDHDLFEDDQGEAVLRCWSHGITDELVCGTIEGRVVRHQFKAAMRRSPFNEPRLDKGDLVFGVDPRNPKRLIRVPIQWFNEHGLTIATTGSGKTTRSRFYALQVAGRIQGVWLFDLRKREWPILKPYFTRLGIELIIVPGRLLRLNPLQVPYGVDPADWVANVSDMFVGVLDLPPRASKLIQTVLFRLYHSFGVFDGAVLYPTLFDLLDSVKTHPDANPQSRAAIVDALEPVLLSLGPKVLGYRLGWTTRDLARYCLAFEFAGLAEVDKNLLLNTLLLSEFMSRIAQGVSNVLMNLWICLDEAQRLCMASSRAGDSAISNCIGLIRGTGIGLDLSVQSTDAVSAQVVSNTGIKMIGRCGSYTDVTAAGHCMGLNADQIRYIQQKLQTGTFVCQLGEADAGGSRQPFLCRIPPMNLKPPGTHGSPGPTGPCDLGPLKGLPVA
jgi:hypothetical protein